MSFYVCGDTHQDIDLGKLNSKRFCAKHLNKNDYVLICGDCGALWDNGSADRYLQKWYDKKPWTTLFIDGNHENFDLLEAYPISEWNGGLVHFITPSLIHLMRGQVYTIDGRKIFTMGGASSHDKERRKEGFSWWASELPTEEELESARKNLVLAENRVDYIFTHCAGNRMQNIVSPEKERNRLTDFLDSLENISFKEWYFGHYHKDLQADEKHVAIFEKVIQLWQYKDLNFVQIRKDNTMDHGKLAKEYFMKGYNCSQAILLAFSDRTGLDEKTAAKIASSFGGGMGRMREVCGAFSGMLLAFGMLHGYDAADETANRDKKEQYERVQELAKRFREEFGSIICRELLTGSAKAQIKAGERADNEQISAMLSDSAVPTERTEAYYKKRPCPELVEEGARILETYLKELEQGVV